MKSSPPGALENNEIKAALSKCRKLDDPVALWAKAIPWLLLLGVISVITPSLLVLFSSTTKIIESEIFVLLALAVGISSLLTWLMFRPFHTLALKPKVLYLRAFSHDRNLKMDHAFRNALRIALPSKFALAGIRPPYARIPWFVRAAAEGWAAMRYLGSNHFELEAADRNWFARLLASGSASHAIIIDLRELTPFVHDEIELAAALAISPGRLFLVIDDSLSEEEWYNRFTAAAKKDKIDRSIISLIKIPQGFKEHPQEFIKKTAVILASIPDDVMEVSALAYQKACSRVAATDWNTPWRETSAARFIVIGLVMMALSTLIFRVIPAEYASNVLITLGALTVLAYIITFTRISKHTCRQARLNLKPKPGIFALIVSSGAFAMLILIPLSLIFVMNRVKNSAKKIQSQALVYQLDTTISMFYLEYGTLPTARSQFSSDSVEGAILLDVLVGREKNTAEELLNPKNISFATIADHSLRQRPDFLSQSSGAIIVDPFGNPYTFVFDADYDEELKFEYGGKTIHLSGRQCAIFSPGKDGVFGNEDDVTSF